MYIKKDKQAFQTVTRRVIYFAKFVSRTFHFWGHLTIHYAGEICVPFFPLFGHIHGEKKTEVLFALYFFPLVGTY